MTYKMETTKLPNYGILEAAIPKDITDDLWKLIEEAKQNPVDKRPQLAGVITSSLALNAETPIIQKFLQSFLAEAIEKYCKDFGTLRLLGDMEWKGPLPWHLSSLWVNFQNKHEFNPLHDHAGVLSFVVWMKIPYDHEEQSKLEIAHRSNSKHDVGNFGFMYSDILGGTRSYIFQMDKEREGMMVLFPSRLKHQVFPFYECDEERVSISGNLDIPIKTLASHIGGLELLSGDSLPTSFFRKDIYRKDG